MDLNLKSKARKAVRPLAVAGAGIAASGMATAATFNFPAMGKLDNITGDFATILEGNFIDLIIAVAIIATIGVFVMFFRKVLNRAGI